MQDDGGPARTGVRAWLRDLLVVLAIAGAYYVGARFGLGLALGDSTASAVWPPSGIALAALLLLGLRYWPAIFLGAFLAELGSLHHLPAALTIGAGNTLEAVAGAFAVRTWASGVRAFRRPRDVFAFLGLAGLATPIIAATIGSWSLVGFGLVDAADGAAIWRTWWQGDAAGAIVLAPVLVLWATPSPPERLPARRLESAAAFACVLAVGAVVWGPWALDAFGARPYAFVTTPFLVWVAVRLGARMTSLAVLTLDSIALWGTLAGSGPFVLDDPHESLLYLQGFLVTAALLTLPTAALAHQQAASQAGLRRAAERLEADVAARTRELQEQADRLRASEKALRASVQRTDDVERVTNRGSWEWDLRANRWVWSKGMHALFGVDPATFASTSESFLSLVHPDDRERMTRALTDALAKPGRFVQEYRVVRPDGKVRHLRGEGDVATGADDAPSTLHGAVADVTDLKHLEEARRKAELAVASSEERLRIIFDHSEVSITLTRPDGTVIDLNPAAEALFKRPRAEWFAPGFHLGQLYADPSQRAEVVARLRATGHARDLELRMRRGDGEVRTMSFNVAGLRYQGGTAFLATAQDITDLRRSQERVLESESRLRAILDNASDAIVTGDATAAIVGWNRAAERIFGRSEQEALGSSIATLLTPEQWADYQQDIALHLQGQPSRYLGRPREMKAVRKDGAELDIELSLALWMSAAGPMFTGVVRDITERKATERAARRAQERFASIFAGSPLAISLSFADGRIADVNPAFADLSGYEPGELLDPGFAATALYDDPQERAALVADLRASGKVTAREFRLRRKDGTTRTVLGSLEFLDMGGAKSILGMFQDVTALNEARAEREARLASEAELERLRRADRFRTEFINSTAHELKTPLTPLVIGVSTLAADKHLTETQHRSVETMQRNVARLRRLVDDLLGAADVQARTLALDKRRLNLTRELRAAVAAIHPAAERAGVTIIEPEDAGLGVSGDPAKLQLVLAHLLGNAVKFTPPGGRVAVASRRDGERVLVEVADTGAGLTARQIEGLWKPFAQAHDKSQRTDSGSGLGLYVAKGIVEAHGGEVGCSSAGPGKGATFWFTLPLAVGHVDPLAKGHGEADGDAARGDLDPGAGI